MDLLTDTHCHLNSPHFAGREAHVVTRAAAAGVAALVVPAWDRASAETALALAETFPAVRAAVGLHPWFVAADADTAWVAPLLAHPRVVAVGEIGLDGAIDGADAAVQERVFRAQLALAVARGLPVLLHCRRRWDRLPAIIRDYPGLRGVLHAFSGSAEVLRDCLRLGLHVSFAGGVTRPNSRHARAAAALVPADRLLLETDAPYMALEGVPAEAVEPAHLPQILAAVAALRGDDPAALAAQTAANARMLGLA
jgi:TatD DNase family protein